MNCIHPTAPAELGPMLRPKFDSILLIEASTCQGMPYVAPARCQRAFNSGKESVRGASVETVHPGGRRIEPSAFGTSALGKAACPSGTTAKTGPEAPEALAAATSASASVTMAAAFLIGLGRLGMGETQLGNLAGRRRLAPGGRPLIRDLLLERTLEGDEEVVPVGRGVGSKLSVDLARDDEVDQRPAEGLHVEELALFDGVVDLVGARLPDQVGDPSVVDHQLDRGDPAAIHTRDQPLADDAAEDAGEDRADHRLLDAGEELGDPAESLGGVDRVHRREDEVAGFGRLERGLGRLGISELADQDHVRVLAERTAQRLAEGLRVQADLALVHDAPGVPVQELDRVFDRDDVLAAVLVDVVEHRGERRGLARAGGARDEDEASVLFREPADAGGHLQLVEARYVSRDDAEGEGDRASLHEAVDAVPGEIVRG